MVFKTTTVKPGKEEIKEKRRDREGRKEREMVRVQLKSARSARGQG